MTSGHEDNETIDDVADDEGDNVKGWRRLKTATGIATRRGTMFLITIIDTREDDDVAW